MSCLIKDKVALCIDDDGSVKVVWLFRLLVAEEKISLVYIWDTSTCSNGSLENRLALGTASTSAFYRIKQQTKSIFSTDIFKLLKFQININTVGFGPRTFSYVLSNAFNHSGSDSHVRQIYGSIHVMHVALYLQQNLSSNLYYIFCFLYDSWITKVKQVYSCIFYLITWK